LEEYEDEQSAGEPECQAEHADEAHALVTDQISPGDVP